MKFLLLLFLFSINTVCSAQTKKHTATKITGSIKLDGKSDDAAWKNIGIINDFIISYPDFGKQPTKATEVKIAYNNEAIYVLATMFDDANNVHRQ